VSSDAKSLPSDIAAAHAMILAERAARLAAEAERDQSRSAASQADALVAHLSLEIEKLKRTLYGVRSESKQRLLEQLELQLEDAQAAATEDELAAERAASSSVVASFERRRPVRKPFPAHLPRERVVVAAPTACPCCGSHKLSKLGEDVTETLEVIPRQWKVIQTVRERFSCRACETITQAPAPFHTIPRGLAGPSLLAMVLFEKFGQHQPLNRQSERYAREGIDLSLSTLADHVGACAAALAPLHALIEAHVLAAVRLHGDDTTVPILAKGKTDTGRIWVYVRDDRPFGGQGPPAALFYASRDRTAGDIWPTGAVFSRPTPTAATTGSMRLSASQGGLSRRCAGVMRGASSSSLPTSPPARDAARTRRRSRPSRLKPSNASTRSSISSAISEARAPKSGCACGATPQRRSSSRWKHGFAQSAANSRVMPLSPKPSTTCSRVGRRSPAFWTTAGYASPTTQRSARYGVWLWVENPGSSPGLSAAPSARP
jgi:transposase